MRSRGWKEKQEGWEGQGRNRERGRERDGCKEVWVGRGLRRMGEWGSCEMRGRDVKEEGRKIRNKRSKRDWG